MAFRAKVISGDTFCANPQYSLAKLTTYGETIAFYSNLFKSNPLEFNLACIISWL